MLDRAIIIASTAHLGQKDKAGEPYILHPIRVMFSRKTEIERICSVLHDVIEDTNITLEQLKNEGFSEEILSALDALTKRDGEDYDEFIDRVLRNKIDCYVKLADLSDNIDLKRINNPTEEDLERVKKYRRAMDRIAEVIGGDGEID